MYPTDTSTALRNKELIVISEDSRKTPKLYGSSLTSYSRMYVYLNKTGYSPVYWQRLSTRPFHI